MAYGINNQGEVVFIEDGASMPQGVHATWTPSMGGTYTPVADRLPVALQNNMRAGGAIEQMLGVKPGQYATVGGRDQEQGVLGTLQRVADDARAHGLRRGHRHPGAARRCRGWWRRRCRWGAAREHGGAGVFDLQWAGGSGLSRRGGSGRVRWRRRRSGRAAPEHRRRRVGHPQRPRAAGIPAPRRRARGRRLPRRAGC